MIQKAEKSCCTCGKSKKVECFSKNRKAKDGLQARCKECQKESDAERAERNRKKNNLLLAAPLGQALFKVCGTCGESQELMNFSRDTTKEDGKCSSCKTCQKKYRETQNRIEYMREYQGAYRNTPQSKKAQRDYRQKESTKQRNRERQQTPEHKRYMKLYQDVYEDTHLEKGLVDGAKTRAEKFFIPFSITEDDISVPATCPVLGIPIRRARGVSGDNSPSLDRFIPNMGYVPDNIFVISNRANRIKNSGTAEEHRRISEWMSSGHPSGEFLSLSKEVKQIVVSMYHNAKRRAKDRDLLFELTKEDIQIPRICPVFGWILRRGVGRLESYSPTLDRIDSSLGYFKGNVVVISYRANLLKNDGTAEEHLKIADWMDSMLQSKVLDTNHEEEDPNGFE
jgi:hypothetical protein